MKLAVTARVCSFSSKVVLLKTKACLRWELSNVVLEVGDSLGWHLALLGRKL